MKNSTEIFSMALGLEEPWHIADVVFDKTAFQLDIYLKFTRGYKFKTPSGESLTAHDTVTRRWEHLNFFQHKCYIHADVPRVKSSDGTITTQPVPWARKGSGFTLLFEALAMLLIENEMPINKAAKVLDIYPNRIWNIFNYWISQAHQADVVAPPNKIGFDETSVKKGHKYVSSMVDLDLRRVLYATEGKGANCITESINYLKEKDVDTEQITQVCIDMSPAFIAGCNNELPHAAITFDKFHVTKEVNKAMDELRKSERRNNELLKGHKYTFLKNGLSPEKQAEREMLMDLYPKLGEGYRLKELFRDFWDIEDKDEAEGYLAYWCDMAQDCAIPSFQKLIKTIKSHWTGIVTYIESKINNGILEGLNSKIQLAKKRARGYRNVDNFINMIYFLCGKLKFNYPLYST